MVLEIFDKILITLLAFSGYAVGNILVNLAHEEIKSGKIYFFLLRNIMAVFIIFSLVFNYRMLIYLLIPAALILILLIFSYKRTNIGREQGMHFVMLGALITVFFTNNQEFVFLIVSLIFIYSLASVALLSSLKKHKKD
ncbi:MAG: hypothetical protein KJ767_02140 [Nanoarchaeota archaeon]|nr:hypothetical protein [Nanoarchaeota archaeon]